jgi:hypothetical protein
MITTTMICVEWFLTRYPRKKIVTEPIRVRLVPYSTHDYPYLYLETSVFVFVSEAIRINLNKNMKIVGTLNQGYPLLQYENTVPVRQSLATRWIAPDPTTWVAPGPPRGQERWYIPGCNQLDRTSTRKRRTHVRTAQTPEYDTGLPSKCAGSLGQGLIRPDKDRAFHNEVPG